MYGCKGNTGAEKVSGAQNETERKATKRYNRRPLDESMPHATQRLVETAM